MAELVMKGIVTPGAPVYRKYFHRGEDFK